MKGIIEGLIRSGLINKKIKLIAVETEGADCFSKSIEQNKLVTLDSITSIAKTLGAKVFDSILNEVFNFNKSFF